MPESFDSVREEYRLALESYQDAAQAIEDFDPEAEVEEGAETPDLDSLEAKFNEAEQTFEGAKEKLELFERTQKARAVAIPDTPKGEKPGSVRVNSEPLTYTRESARNGVKFFRDVFRRDLHGDSAAGERLDRHMREMADREEFDLSSTDAAGGYLVSPLYLNEEFVALARAGRVAANVIGSKALPPDTDNVNVPVMTTGTAVAAQSDGGSVQKTDAAFGITQADVKTIAGMQDVSQQLVDRSVPGVDEVIFADLTKAYNVNLDTAVLNSSTSNNHGLLQVSTPYTSTYTASTPTVSGLYSKIADAIQGVETNVFLPPNAILMHPRRWAWILAASDSNNRPLVVPGGPAFNQVGTFDGVVPQGGVGSIQGIPVYTDPNIPTNLGAGTNEDRIIVLPTDEEYLWEDQSGPYLDTFRDVGSGTLTVRFRLFNYYAQLFERRQKQHAIISGTGLATPTF